MELKADTLVDSSSTYSLASCDRGEHNFIQMGEPQKREDAARTIVGVLALCTKCGNTTFVVVAEQSRIAPAVPIHTGPLHKG